MENKDGKYSGHFSKKLKAGKRRTYFFDVRSTKQGDYFLTITESKKKFDGDGYESHKVFLYKEDFKKFMEALNETINYVKTDLAPDFDYDAERPVSPSRPHSEEVKEERREEKANTKVSLPDTPSTESNATPPISDDEEVNWN